MTPNRKFSAQQFFRILILTTAWIMFLAVTGRAHAIAASPAIPVLYDTLPQAEVFNLKKADISRITEKNDSVFIRLNNQDSILMSRSGFDALPADVRKELAVQQDGVFTRVTIESAYPGGTSAWMRYMMETFRYPQQAVKEGVQGTVVVQFMVDEKGKVSNIEAVSGPDLGGLRYEAIRVIRQSGKWTPAILDGSPVKSFKRQSIIFQLAR